MVARTVLLPGMSGTHPDGWSYDRYLSAKVTVDDRALNRLVVDNLKRALAARPTEGPLRILEIGGGTGTMVRRAIDWGIVGHAEYVLLDADADLVRNGFASLSDWAGRVGLSVEIREQETVRLHKSDGSIDVLVRGVRSEIGAYLSVPRDFKADLLVASAFLDLVELPRMLPALLALADHRGLFWFPINFDGETIFEPAHALDAPLIGAYHRAMDERVRFGQRAGESKTGRKLIHAIAEAGGRVAAAGSSDWVVFAQDGSYPDDEAYFLRCILATIEESLSQRSDVDQANLQTWIAARRAQLDEGMLVYVAHQIDVAGTVR
jgi:hypothetical protein